MLLLPPSTKTGWADSPKNAILSRGEGFGGSNDREGSKLEDSGSGVEKNESKDVVGDASEVFAVSWKEFNSRYIVESLIEPFCVQTSIQSSSKSMDGRETVEYF